MPYNKLSFDRRIKATFPKIKKNIYEKISELSVTAFITEEPETFENRRNGEERVLKIGDNWGSLFGCAWMNFKGKLPKKAEPADYVLIIDISGEGYVCDDNGVPVQGITTFSSFYDFKLGMPGKKAVYIDKLIANDGSIDIWVDAANNDLFGNLQNNGTLIEAYIAKVKKNMHGLYYDFEVLLDLKKKIPETKARFVKIQKALYDASLLLVDYSDEEAKKAREIIKPELERKNSNYPLNISAIGHSHIDLAWLWPIRETIRKGARTFSTVLANLDRYEDYIFGASQPQLYEWMKEYYPNLYKKIKKAVKDGRWEIQGAMWVEADTNVTGGEALIRQMLYGKKFFNDEFNVEVKNVWLPDVFGYSAALPQIMKKSDVDYFMTTKLSWSEFNGFPHHTFVWRGLDGSEVLAHMPPEGTYNSSAAPRAIIDTEEKFKDKILSEEAMLLYGIGDGGGGPGEEHLERLKREKNLQGIAPVKQEHASVFFDRINKDFNKYKTWDGELYLEYHRGTYTNEGRNKKYNKVMEMLLRDTEIISCINGYDYNLDKVEKIWKEVLLYQFHDILPGSSIKRVYDESCERYELLINDIEELLTLSSGTSGDGYTIFNTLSWKRKEWIKINNDWMNAEVRPLSSVVFEPVKEKDGYNIAIDEKASVIENAFLKLEFGEEGSLISVFDKVNNRETVKTGCMANELNVYKDDGDAWDFSNDFKDYSVSKPILEAFAYNIDGPMAVRSNKYKTGNSTIYQRIILKDGAKRVDIHTVLEWNDPNTMLRAAFPLNVKSKDLTCGIQFGFVQRPSHDNTLWDLAKLEVCCQDYADISEIDYGTAVLSDYKFGFSSTLDTIELCLLRSTTFPNTEGDIGRHEFTYSIYPHKGNHIEGDVIKQGMELSRQLRTFSGSSGTKLIDSQFLTLSEPNIFIETIKKAENGKGVIVRLYESEGKNTSTEIITNRKYTALSEVNMLEKELNRLGTDTDKLALRFSPFEIKTLLLF